MARFLRIILLSITVLSFLTGVSRAEILATDQVVEKYATQADKAQITALLKRADVRQQLKEYGVEPEEAEKRIAALSDEEIRQIADQLESEPAGAGELGTVLGVALTVFLVLLVTDILCLTDVFSFTRCARR
ncbi:PA2779 family protein [Luteithermobacter gelatinilyticus]|uniref:PA2779 family protein n=1 Tax=Luteithermobacter gelatinilyticus TaxID=2582913 RepID=UPI0011071FEB|nr:PA2779 family protein [Luteithermobacter gelatinilyticus]